MAGATLLWGAGIGFDRAFPLVVPRPSIARMRSLGERWVGARRELFAARRYDTPRWRPNDLLLVLELRTVFVGLCLVIYWLLGQVGQVLFRY